jgi:hypothetical protein
MKIKNKIKALPRAVSFVAVCAWGMGYPAGPSLSACSGLGRREQRILSRGAGGAGAGTVRSTIIGGSLFTGAAVGAPARA